MISETSLDGSQTRLIGGLPEQPAAPALEQGTLVGRYVVLEEVGRGGMGQVYRAYDPKLGREVAIKRLSLREGCLSTEGAERMLREAQAMAKLSHPNVVPVYDVEGDGGELFIAMEFVEGESIRQWLDAASRSWSEVVAVFREAGEGLAAAHQAGLVHRDFKPGNVMVGKDGRARVMDFGLARVDAPLANASAMTTTGGDPDEELGRSNELTQAGTVMGTPAYMAPEQHLDDASLGPASDQYAFCVALWEAVYRARPFVDEDYRALVSAKLAGPPHPPAGTHVPPWLHRVIERGLAPEGIDRWPSMQQLLVALGRDPAARRRQILTGGLAVGFMGALALVARSSSSTPDPCEGATEQLGNAWDEDTAEVMRAALEGTGQAYAADTARLGIARLDDYAGRWVEVYEDACRATHERRTQSSEVLDHRMACLGSARAELRVAVGLLSHDVSPKTVERASGLISGLPRLDRCSDIESLLAEVPLPQDPAVKQSVEELQARLAEVDALERAGRVSDALAAVAPLVEQARETGYMPILARAHRSHAGILVAAGKFEDATSHSEQAYLLAIESGDDRLAASSATQMGFIVGDRQGQVDEAHHWLDTAGALSRRVGAGGAPEGWYLNNLGNVLKVEGRTDEAIAAYDRAEAIFAEVFSPDHEYVGMVLNNAGIALNEQRRPKEALPKLERSVQFKAAGMGPMHPSHGMGLTNLGLVLYALHRFEDALDRHTQARDIFAASLGTDHPNYAATLTNMGMAFTAMERLDEAEPLLRESLRIKEASLGPEHRGLVPQLVNLSELVAHQGKTEQTLTLLERAHEILVAHHGHRHPLVAMLKINIGSVKSELGHGDEARRWLTDAVTYYEEAEGPSAPSLWPALSAMGELETRAGNDAVAEELFERVQTIQISQDTPAPELATTRFRLAKLRWARAEARDEALALARQALEGYAEGDPSSADEVRQWLATHG